MVHLYYRHGREKEVKKHLEKIKESKRKLNAFLNQDKKLLETYTKLKEILEKDNYNFIDEIEKFLESN